MSNINEIVREMSKEIGKLSYVYKTIKFGGSTEAEIMEANGPLYDLSFGGRKITMEQAKQILDFYDMIDDIR